MRALPRRASDARDGYHSDVVPSQKPTAHHPYRYNKPSMESRPSTLISDPYSSARTSFSDGYSVTPPTHNLPNNTVVNTPSTYYSNTNPVSSPSIPQHQEHQQDVSNQHLKYRDESFSKRRYVCEICLKRFTRPSSLETHMNSHTGARPFVCTIQGCDKSFSVSSNLRRHMKLCDPGAKMRSIASVHAAALAVEEEKVEGSRKNEGVSAPAAP